MTTYTVRSTSDCHYGIFATLEGAEHALRMVRRIDPDAQIFVTTDWRDRRALAAEAAIARVRELHHSKLDRHPQGDVQRCIACLDLWPCPTIKALDGEK